VAEILYVRMVQREECLMSQNADSRLETFRGTFPGLIDRARKADIASYLNIRPETLSRLLNRSR
jgi:CRP-like cAMP-binding protein